MQGINSGLKQTFPVLLINMKGPFSSFFQVFEYSYLNIKNKLKISVTTMNESDL